MSTSLKLVSNPNIPATDDLRVRAIRELAPPAHLVREYPCTTRAAETTAAARTEIHRVLDGSDDRLLVVVGPCSIHDAQAAREYAARLAAVRERFRDDLAIVMRVYFEKPRTTVGWKGLINDPHLDDSFDINTGLRLARRLLLEINELGLPAATEYLDLITPQYIADLISWGAIGARTTESQSHRQLASGLSCPVGFKNGTDGNVRIAVDAIKAAAAPHHFLGVTKGGHSAIVATAGNSDCHLILRGGKQPNYTASDVAFACAELKAAGLDERVMIDCSHANSSKQFAKQREVGADIADQLAAGERRIVGTMIESHLFEGRQDLVPSQALRYGVSITDACLGWEHSVAMLENLAAGVRARRDTDR